MTSPQLNYWNNTTDCKWQEENACNEYKIRDSKPLENFLLKIKEPKWNGTYEKIEQFVRKQTLRKVSNS